MASEKWYDYSREEQIENGLLRFRRLHDLYKDKYFTNFKFHYVPWWSLNF